MPLFILLGLYTGRRKEAILSLRWPQVDLERGFIDFEIPGRQRTKKQRGAVPLPHKLLPHLRRARRRGTDLGYVLHINGSPIGDIKKGFAAACKRVGIDDVTPHTLRHTAATWLMQSGVKTWEAAGFLAMSEKMLIEVYGHHHPDHMREAARALDRKPRTPHSGADAVWAADRDRQPNRFSTQSRPTPHCEGPNSDRNSLGMLERATGIEPATRSLGSYCSTTELHPRPIDSPIMAGREEKSAGSQSGDAPRSCEGPPIAC